jgi:hypothetical protein
MAARDDVDLRGLFNDASVSIGWTLRVRVAGVGTPRTVASEGRCGRHLLAVSRHIQTRNFPNRGRITSPNGSQSGSRFDPHGGFP